MNLKIIAEELGISPSTVSRVVNGNKNFSVSPELREKILACANAAGYTPNPLYQAMRKKDNRQISILMSNLLHTTVGTEISVGVDCFCEYLLEHGFSFHYLCHTLEHQKTYGLPPWKVAGALAVDVRREELVAELDASTIPYVSLNGAAGPHGTSVITDDYANMTASLEYLYDLGHRRIAVLAKESAEHGSLWNQALLYEGLLHNKNDFIAVREYSLNAYFAMLRELGLSDDPHLLQFSRGTPQEIRRNVDTLLNLPEPPTALIGFSDFYAMYAMQELKVRGIRIPEEISVLGLCGYPGGAYLTPTLTTVSYNYEKIGWKCLELMPELIRIGRCGGEMPDVIMEHRLIERKSTAFPKH